MSIARMKKLSVIGLASDREELMEKLMAMGVVEIRAQEEKLSDDVWREAVGRDGDEKTVSAYEARISRVSQALDVIQKHSNEKSPLLRTRRPVKADDFQRAYSEEEKTNERVSAVNSLSSRHAEFSNLINKGESLRLSLIPWAEYDLPLEEAGTRTADIIPGALPAVSDAGLFIEEMEQKIPASHVEIVHKDDEQHYLYVICDKTKRGVAEEIFRDYGFSKMNFNDLEGTAGENIASAEERIKQLSKEKSDIEEEIRTHEKDRQELELLHDSLIIKRDRADIRHKLLVTKKSFTLEGWLPAAADGKVSGLLSDMGCYFEITDPEKNEETPILLLNGSLSMPFESITKLYALPGSGSIDATPFFALSYAIFFGMMLGDAAYGIIMTLVTGMVLKKYKLEGMKYQLIKMFFYCGIATTFWGAMFGGWFGNIVSIVGKTFFNADVSIPPIWFDPLAEPMKLLIFCFILGGIHLFLGMGLNAWLSIKDGRPWDAVFDVGFWYLLLIGATLLLVGVVPVMAKWMAITGAVGILLTAGREKRGIGRIIGGLGSLYGITGYLSDVLSYSRLLALGLASGVIASVVNTMGSFGGTGIKGVLIMTFAFVVGHTYNFAINALGSFVHSCRLQYVEFFGKFYVSGGEAFKPFNENTKYVYIQREEN
ncbi:V-type ATP synthase subunit I [Bacillota bacterium]